jgi:hypothetical protein
VTLYAVPTTFAIACIRDRGSNNRREKARKQETGHIDDNHGKELDGMLAHATRASHVSDEEPFLWSAIVHVRSQWRHRQQVLTLMTFASVSTALPLQKGHIEGLATVSSKSDSYMFCYWNVRSRHKVRDA